MNRIKALPPPQRLYTQMEIACHWRRGIIGERKKRDTGVELMTTRVLFAEAVITERFDV